MEHETDKIEIKPSSATPAEVLSVDKEKVRFGNMETDSAVEFITRPKPNILFIISPGDKEGRYATKVAFYRPKYYNCFQRLMYKMCFGITILQGENILNKI